MSDEKKDRVKKIVNFADILDCDASWYFFDIEETILRKNFYYLALSDPQYAAILLDLQNTIGKEVSLFHIMYYGKNFRRQLTDDSLPYLIKRIKKIW